MLPRVTNIFDCLKIYEGQEAMDEPASMEVSFAYMFDMFLAGFECAQHFAA